MHGHMFNGPKGWTVDSSQVTERCRASGPTMENPAHPCYRIRRSLYHGTLLEAPLSLNEGIDLKL